MKSFALLITAALASVATADTLYIQGLNDPKFMGANVNDVAPPLDMRVYDGSDYGYIDLGGGNIVALPELDCVDLQHQIHIPTSYDVTLVPVYDAAAWLYSNVYAATVAGGGHLTEWQDVGLQLAIWDVTYPGIVFSNVTFGGDITKSRDPLYWENLYLTEDGFGALKADGIDLVSTSNYGQTMVIAGPPGGSNGLPGPLAALPFLVGLARRRRRG